MQRLKLTKTGDSNTNGASPLFSPSSGPRVMTRLRRNANLVTLMPSPGKKSDGQEEEPLTMCCGRTRTTHYQFRFQCPICSRWFHNTCCDIETREEVPANYQCEFCIAIGLSHIGSGSKSKRMRSPTNHRTPESPPHPRPVPPHDARLLQSLRSGLLEYVLLHHNCEVVRLTDRISEDYIKQCMDTCVDAVEQGTFAADYPRYCLDQLGQPHTIAHALLHRDSNTMLAWVYTNGKDDVTNFKSTINALRTLKRRRPEFLTTLMENYSTITHFEDFFHVSILATHAKHRGKGYGKILMLLALLDWALLGMTHAYLNMALEKFMDPDTNRTACRPSMASHSLYKRFDFHEAFPKFSPTGQFRWTLTEASFGRLMINMNTRATIKRMSGLFALRGAGDEMAHHTPPTTACETGRQSMRLKLGGRSSN